MGNKGLFFGKNMVKSTLRQIKKKTPALPLWLSFGNATDSENICIDQKDTDISEKLVKIGIIRNHFESIEVK